MKVEKESQKVLLYSPNLEGDLGPHDVTTKIKVFQIKYINKIISNPDAHHLNRYYLLGGSYF